MDEVLTLIIQDRSGILLNTKARTISSFNVGGDFDILPGHANLIALVERRILYKGTDGKNHEFKIGRALLKVNSNKVDVFLSI